ncbi:DUF982 domain-containing protein [Mesorhizobium sp. 131-2-1]|uniref:DUF982 domain-containing protein n=1 Tax=Mesorhizobium sp. 131-2-1 TaxID=2744518 RepID=UPI0019275483|nr:DUF982 domain-containing protein [Mesorhizobium sp. 131-2-1]BCG95425.1 hypothetical protein MesoLj131a_42890 [Mesorhizobium sp. 131-2-1]
MSRFLPVTIRFANGGSMVVSSIADAKKALGGSWKDKDAPAYVAAVRLVDDALEGICRPAVAFAAFKKAATEQGLLKPVAPSAALAMLDQLWSPGRKPD